MSRSSYYEIEAIDILPSLAHCLSENANCTTDPAMIVQNARQSPSCLRLRYRVLGSIPRMRAASSRVGDCLRMSLMCSVSS